MKEMVGRQRKERNKVVSVGEKKRGNIEEVGK